MPVDVQVNSPELWKSFLPVAQASDNKYTRGHLLINGAPLECTGATKLAAFAAARAGAGMVTVACDDESLLTYQAGFLSIMAKPIKESREFYKYIDHRKVSAVLIGPGNGVNHDVTEKVLEVLQNKNLKIILDADAISVFENNKSALLEGLKAHGNCILTPHEGEFKRLFKLNEDRLQSAQDAAKISGAVVVLKGHETLIAAPDGRVAINKNAPATLATAGTGDVLAGIISGLFVQGMPAFEAACAGVYTHTKAANKLGKGMIAEDLIGVLLKVLS